MINNDKYYQIITGIVSELEVFDTEQQFLKTRKLAGLPALGLFFLGDVVAAASQLNTTDSNEEAAEFLNSVQYFRCKMGSNIIEGIFCRVFFNNGDQVEVVVEPRSDGSYFAYALRRLIDHRLWLHPWATKGTKAGNKSALKFAVLLMSVIFVFTIIFMLINTSLDEYYIFLIALPVILVLDILLGVLVYFLHKSILSKGSHLRIKFLPHWAMPILSEWIWRLSFINFMPIEMKIHQIFMLISTAPNINNNPLKELNGSLFTAKHHQYPSILR